MGGRGSGRGMRWTKTYCEDYLNLDIRKIVKAGRFNPGEYFTWQWIRKRSGKTSSINIYVADKDTVTLDYTVTASGESKTIEDTINIEWTDCYFGGSRPWFECPDCERRVAVLYAGKHFLCRKCHGLAYGSQSEARHYRIMHRLQNRRIKLGADGNMFDPFPPRPKGMHTKTYERHLRRATVEEYHYWGMAEKMFGRSYF